MKKLLITSFIILFSLSYSISFDNPKQDLDPNSIWTVIKQNFKLPSGRHVPEVQQKIKWFQKHPENIEKIFKSSKPYLAYIVKECIENQLPTELALIPAVESAFNPLAHSKAGASGLWQMMPGTATARNIPIDWWYDGRRDIIDSTQGALEHFKWLATKTNHKWNLAISAYDAGLGRVKRSYDINNTKKYQYQLKKLPRETQNYLYKLLAMKEIISNPEKYHHSLPKISTTIPFVSIKVNHPIHLAEFKSHCHFDPHLLNRGFKRWVSSPTLMRKIHVYNKNTECSLRFLQKNAIGYRHKLKPVWIRHLVSKNENLSSIALKYHTTSNNIKKANNLKSDVIQPSTILFIPAKFTKKVSNPPSFNHTFKKTITGDHPNSHQLIRHVVKKNESLESISKKYNTPRSHLIYWNRLSTSKLMIGDQLLIWKSPTQKMTSKGKRHVKVKLKSHKPKKKHQ